MFLQMLLLMTIYLKSLIQMMRGFKSEQEFNPEMFASTAAQARDLVPSVRFGQVFNLGRLTLQILLAIALTLAAGLLLVSCRS